MKIYKLLITLLFSALISLAINVFNITDFVNTKIEAVKYKEMKYICSETYNSEDTYTKNQQDNSDANEIAALNKVNGSIKYPYSGSQSYMFLQNLTLAEKPEKSTVFNTELTRPKSPASAGGGFQRAIKSSMDSTNIQKGLNPPLNEVSFNIAGEKQLLSELKNHVEEDSYRNRDFGIYYIFNFDYTMNELNQLDSQIEKVAKAQKMPKAFLSAVLFREMMFMGQEDMLDGFPVIGGKTIGLCQIGIENVKFNEQIVHGKESLILNKTDDEILKMLREPEKAVYFCAVQLRARALQLYGKNNDDINKFDSKHMKQVFAAYNQFDIPFNIGPVMNKEMYAEQTYKYYELFSKYYALKQN